MTDAFLEDRVNALDMALFIAEQDARHLDGRHEFNPWALTVAFRDVRKALAAYQRHEELPVPEFPSVKELIQLATLLDATLAWKA